MTGRYQEIEIATRAVSEPPGERYGDDDEKLFRRVPTIVSDAAGRLVFAFSGGRVVVADAPSDAVAPTRA